MSLNELLADIPKPWSNIRVNSIKVDNGVIIPGLTDGHLLVSSNGAIAEGTSATNPTFQDVKVTGIPANCFVFTDGSQELNGETTLPIIVNGNGYQERKASAFALTNGVAAPVQFDGALTNTMGSLVTITNTFSRYTFHPGANSVDILFSFTMFGAISALTGSVQIYLLKNNLNQYGEQIQQVTALTTPSSSTSFVIRMIEGDFIEFYANVTGASVSLDGLFTMKQLL